MEFECKQFRDLSAGELYAMLMLRSEDFVVEQQCGYLDPDGRDLEAYHLFGWSTARARSLACEVRILRPGSGL